jgi:hypothetical protein
VALTLCGHRSDIKRIYAAKELKQNETLQTVEETLFANRKSKETRQPPLEVTWFLVWRSGVKGVGSKLT